MKYAIINHDPLDASAPRFTFKIEDNRKIGDLILCNTRRGLRLGRIEKFIDANEIDFEPTATAVKINASRRRLLSSYDKAIVAFFEGERDPEKLINSFKYDEDHSRASFLYKYLDAWSVKHYYEDGIKFVDVMLSGVDYDGEVCGISHIFCLG